MMRSGQGGSILLIAVLLGGLLAALAISLLASAALESRGVAHADAARAARRDARSGVALAAAQRLEGKWEFSRSTHAPGPGAELVIDVDPGREPQLRVAARNGGARCELAADLALDSVLGAYALAVFGEGSAFAAPLEVGGSAYFAARERPFDGAALLDLEGDLDLAATAGGVDGPRFAHVGRLRGSRRSAELPQLDFVGLSAELERRGVLVQRLRGGGTLKDASLRGVLWVELGPEEELVCENLRLDGALVVCPIDGEAELLPTATRHGRLALRGASELRSSTEVLATLALAAPCTELRLDGAGNTRVRGLALVGAARDLHDLELEGALWARGTVQVLHRARIALPEVWELDLPVALRAPRELTRVRVEWR